MPLITWTDELSVSVKDLDSQHQKLFDLVNELHEAMRSGKGKEAVGSILNRLADYTKTHLFYEERLMRTPSAILVIAARSWNMTHLPNRSWNILPNIRGAR